jgi:hypothetical protein
MDRYMDLNNLKEKQKMIRNSFLKRNMVTRIQGMMLLLSCASSLAAQAGIGASGGHATSEEISFSYSVGQVFNNEISNAGYYVSLGIQNPMLLVVTETQVHTDEAVGMEVYPNPVADQLHIVIQEQGQERCRVLIVNMQGKILIDKTFDVTEFVISLKTINTGHYLLKVIRGNTVTKTFKIIKSQ